MHVPFDTPDTPVEEFEPYPRLLERHEAEVVHVAHSHVNDVNTQVIPGAWHVETNSTGHNTNDQTPPGFRHVTLDADRASFPCQPFDQERRLTPILPAPGGQVTATEQTLQVNAVDSAREVEQVLVKVDGRAVTPLARTGWMTRAARWDASRLDPGRHEATIVARDDTGERWERRVRFEVVTSRSVTPPPRSRLADVPCRRLPQRGRARRAAPAAAACLEPCHRGAHRDLLAGAGRRHRLRRPARRQRRRAQRRAGGRSVGR